MNQTSPESPTATRPGRAPLTASQQHLATRYLPLARTLAKPLKRGWPAESDEFESAACLALVEAAQSFDATRNVKFATFARYRIWGALRDVQRSLAAPGWEDDPEDAPRRRSLGADAEESGRVLGAEPDAPVGADVEEAEALESWLRKLPAKHAEVCRQIYRDGKTQTEAAKAMGYSTTRLGCLHKESLEMLKAPNPPRLGGMSPAKSR